MSDTRLKLSDRHLDCFNSCRGMKDTGYEKDVVLSNCGTLDTLLRQLDWQCLVIHASSRTATKGQATVAQIQNQH